MNLYRGEGNLPDLLLPTAEGTFPFPVKFAYQTVGEIVEVGSHSPWKVGDRVFCQHPHQDLFNITPAPGIVTRIPGGFDPQLAVFGGQFTVAVNSLLDAPARVGDYVAVSGLGLIGTFCAYLARKNAFRLVLIDPAVRRRERAGWIGADAVVGPDDARTVIDELTGNRGVDLFIEASGAPPALQLALQTTMHGGTIDVTSWYGTRSVELLLSPEFHLRHHRVHSSHVGAIGTGVYPGRDRKRAFESALEYLKHIDRNVLKTHEFPFAEAPRAYELVDTAPDDMLGVILIHGGF
jgi:threonine dehydrogenase-like Zn-dependent dehydrogenase